jgi:hypothetical protein
VPGVVGLLADVLTDLAGRGGGAAAEAEAGGGGGAGCVPDMAGCVVGVRGLAVCGEARKTCVTHWRAGMDRLM